MFRPRAAGLLPLLAISCCWFLYEENSDAEPAGLGRLRRSLIRQSVRRRANHCKVSASYMGSSDELMAKLRGGSAGNYDVISPPATSPHRSRPPDLAAPLDLTKLPSYGPTFSQLTSLPLVRANDKVYGVPFMWGPDPIIYDTTAFPQPPDSLELLWDPKYQRKDFCLGRSLHRLHGGPGPRL